MAERYYTVEEANALLPWLESVLAELQALQGEMARQQAALAALGRHARRNGHSGDEREAHQGQQRFRELRERAEALLAEVARRNILVRDVDRGLVDFPALREGRQVYLCWLRGEPAVTHWHEVDAGFAGRQPL